MGSRLRMFRGLLPSLLGLEDNLLDGEQTMSTQTLDVKAKQTEEIVSCDPATEEVAGCVPPASAEEVAESVNRARKAQQAWARRSYSERGKVVMRARQIV